MELLYGPSLIFVSRPNAVVGPSAILRIKISSDHWVNSEQRLFFIVCWLFKSSRFQCVMDVLLSYPCSTHRPKRNLSAREYILKSDLCAVVDSSIK
jgi:hypothetical protein